MKHTKCIAATALLLSALPLSAATYYVDYKNGDDANEGTSSSSPWKHAPGDVAATGAPASVKLAGGDVVQFRGGVSYRGSIQMKYSGTSAAPITYSGTGWGQGRAIIDGADPVTSIVDCPSRRTCGGAPNWQKLKLVTFDTPKTRLIRFFDQLGPIYEAQYPASPDSFWDDDIANYAVTPKGQAGTIETGRLENAALAAQAAKGGSDLYLTFWVYGNLIESRKVKAVSRDTIYFDATNLRLYKDRDGRVALMGSPHTLHKEGSYALVAPNQAVVLPREGGGQIMVGSGRYGFDTRSLSNIKITGFHFARGTGATNELTTGLAIYNGRYFHGKNWTISNNVFGPAVLQHGRGIVTLAWVDGVDVSDNSFHDIQRGSGVRAAPNVRNLNLSGNRVTRVGRTGLYLGGVENATLRGNILHDIHGVHGNAMSFYLKNRNITVENNCVYNSVRPVTFHGEGGGASGASHNLLFKGNILVGSRESVAAINSWGSNTNEVTITRNIALGGKAGIRLHSSDIGVTVTENRTSGVITQGRTPGDWTLRDNVTGVPLSSAREGELTSTACSMDTSRGTLAVSIN